MGGIVLEFQEEALDKTVSIESLLRKAYLLAKKLKLKDLKIGLYCWKRMKYGMKI